MTNPTLERAARAVHEAAPELNSGWGLDNEDAKKIARAVLMAVRSDPGEDAVKKGGTMRYHGAANYGAEEIFTAMIDAILRSDGQ